MSSGVGSDVVHGLNVILTYFQLALLGCQISPWVTHYILMTESSRIIHGLLLSKSMFTHIALKKKREWERKQNKDGTKLYCCKAEVMFIIIILYMYIICLYIFYIFI